jgi:hypothetical protein
MLAGNNPEAQKEALKAANKGWDKPPAPLAPPPSAPSPSFGGGSFGAPTPSFGGASFGQMTTAPVADFTPQVVTGFGGKPMPVQPPQPEL